MNRRDFVAASVGAAGIAAIGGSALARQPETRPESAAPRTPLKGRIHHSVCKWCYSMPLDELCRNAKEMSIASVELLDEKEWGTVDKFGLRCAVANGPVSIGGGINRPESHDKFVADCERLLPLVKKAAIPTMIVFSGNRRGMPDDKGMENCAAALRRVTPIAEAEGVTIIMELLNSQVDHKDYMCDRTPWGVSLVKAVGSPRFRLLYDIYHMQIMEGDVIRTIKDNAAHIAHYHTGGVPGRREIDSSQELFYPAICRAIAESGGVGGKDATFSGFVAQEFIPSRDAMTSLREAVAICDV